MYTVTLYTKSVDENGYQYLFSAPVELRSCGGLFVEQRPCDEGMLCVDDPRDDCDPTNGGADCPSVCQAPMEPEPGKWIT